MKIFMITISVMLILTGCAYGPKDYVSAYDFSSAHLVDLPWELGATIVGPPSSFEYDEYVKRNHPDWNFVQHALGGQDLFFFDGTIYGKAPEEIVAIYNTVDSESCRLIGGELMHMLYISNGVVTVEAGTDDFRLSVEVLAYQDYNEDGYMDVLVIRRLPGSACPQEGLVLSRRSANGPFHVVACRNGSVRLQTGHSVSWEFKDDGSVVETEHVYLDKGDSIAEISKSYGISEEAIRSASGLGESDRVEEETWVALPMQ